MAPETTPLPHGTGQAPACGILGGMGTAAGLLLQRFFFEACNRAGVHTDQGYPPWIYLNASQVPDRSAALRGEGPSPAPALITAMRQLQACGAEVVAVACNTAHAWYTEVRDAVPMPWVHLQQETAHHLATEHSARRVGVLATSGTLRAHLFRDALTARGLDAVEPDLGSSLQRDVMAAIYDPKFGVKATGERLDTEARRRFANAVAQMVEEHGAEILVAGCTEISVAFTEMELPVPWVDPMAVAAGTLVDIWMGRRRAHDLDRQANAPP